MIIQPYFDSHPIALSIGLVSLSIDQAIIRNAVIGIILAAICAGVITSFLRQKLADKMVVAIAPKIMGRGREAVEELDIREVSQALKLSFEKVYRLGEDLVIEARLEKS